MYPRQGLAYALRDIFQSEGYFNPDGAEAKKAGEQVH
jgi:hypothetical protein